MSDLARLAELLKERNAIDHDIATLIGHPANKGSVGEYIAAAIFEIQLEESASHKSSDGYFINDPLKGKTVNIKWYGKQEGVLDMVTDDPPAYYLVLTGPKAGVTTIKGKHVPWVIEHVFLFDAHALVQALQDSGKKYAGIAIGVAQKYWQASEIYPTPQNSTVILSNEQRQLLGLFQEALNASEALTEVE